MRTLKIAAAIICMCYAGTTLAQTKNTTLTNERQYQAKLEKAKSDYAQVIIAAQTAYAEQLKQDLDKAMIAKNLELAKAIEARQKEVLADLTAQKADAVPPRETNKAGVVIEKAVYGSDRTKFDVTATVRSMVQNGWLQIKEVSDTSPGKDPENGARKTLYVLVSVNGKEMVIAVHNQRETQLVIGPADLMPRDVTGGPKKP